MGNKTPPFEHWEAWTTARFFGFIRSALRAAFNKYPPKYEVIRQAKRDKKDGGRQKFEYECSSCGKMFPQKEIQVDHVIPAGSLKSFDDLPEFCRKLFCGVDDMQILCKPCHKVKTQEERKGNGS